MQTNIQLANVRVHRLGLTDDFLLNLSDRAQTAKVDRTTPVSYNLLPNVSLEEAILDAWDDAHKTWVFTWNGNRRFWLRAELDALYFILYGIERGDVDYIMDTFPIVKRKDIAAHGSYRTKEAILSVYDELQTLGLERLGEYRSRMSGEAVAGGWEPEPEGVNA
ncbi:hypothetical protein FNU79_14055 [Deinococcus detaillensis]|uniref:Uncharacterized protein n=2 Tax=Deinococcus detaillensis TaxID=2592048 RepID=A0A553UPM0_9DEIO|nr:hypothetical protein FNU79_14055 [Deinococcus detaillensis]